jgi:Cys-tRNA(Pro)/Cys-tRNA(Cys) deacylase
MAPTPAVAALERVGVAYSLHTYEHDPSAASYGEEAAEVLGIEPARVFKTLVATTGATLVVGVVPVVATLDLKALAEVVGAKRVAMAATAEAERATGYVVGGISPVGQRKRLATVIDASAEQWSTVFCSGGRRGLEIELSPADLAQATGGRFAPIARNA